MSAIGNMAYELLGRRCIIIPTQTMHLECIENYKKHHNGKTPDCTDCPYDYCVFTIIGYGVTKWGVEKIWLVDEKHKRFSITMDNILLVNEEE